MTVRHFIPLIGPYILACKKLGIKDEDEVYSFEAFKDNDQHVYNNDENKKPIIITGLDDEINPEHDMEKFKKYVEENNVKPTNILTSVPPCAGLSRLNSCSESKNGKARGADAAQNNWIYSAVKFYLATNTDVLVFENAPALATEKGLRVVENIMNIIEKNGYKRKVQLVKTTTINHGLPQNRGRSFMLIHKNENFVLLKNKKHNYISIEDFLSNIVIDEKDPVNIVASQRNKYVDEWNLFYEKNPEIKRLFEETYKDKKEIYLTSWVFLFDMFKENKYSLNDYPIMKKTFEHILNKKNKGKGFWDSSPVFIKGRINAITSKNGFRIFNPINREKFLSIRELMCLMGMPTSFKLADPLKNYNHICQNIPVNTAADSLLWAKECLENKEKIDGYYKFTVHDNNSGDMENKVFGFVDNKYIKLAKKEPNIFEV